MNSTRRSVRKPNRPASPEQASGQLAEPVFLMTDIEGSTRLWERDSDAMRQALSLHDALGAACAAKYRGNLVKARGEGDSLFLVFEDPLDAVLAAADFARVLDEQTWPTADPLRARMAIHQGPAEYTGFDYYGSVVNRCARIRSLAHGGQILLSRHCVESVKDRLPVGFECRDLGLHRLKDLLAPEQIFQLTLDGITREFPPLRALTSITTNLPTQVNAFIGRHDLLHLTKGKLRCSRLVSLVGPGGSGKTRLAVQLAADVLEEYQGGAFLIDLAGQAAGVDAPEAVFRALGLKESPNSDFPSGVIERLKSTATLLVFDNCEHVIDSVAEYIDGILASCPELKVIATSRMSLDIPAECLIQVPPLALPGQAEADTVGLLSCESIQLFLNRAAMRLPLHQFTEAELQSVARIVCAVDGLPLAIELAAARLGDHDMYQLERSLSDLLGTLSKGYRTAPSRQRSLEALVHWSYDLLSSQERHLFERLSILAGRFTERDAIGIVGNGALPSHKIPVLLAALVRCSMLQRPEGDFYQQLQVLRSYGEHQLERRGELEAAREAAFAYYQREVPSQEHELDGQSQQQTLAWFEAAEANILAAISFGNTKHRGAESLELATHVWRYWFIRGVFMAGRRLLVDGLATAPDAPAAIRARALNCIGTLAWRQGRLDEARAACEESLRLYLEVGDQVGSASALSALGSIATDSGDFRTARALLSEAFAARQAQSDLRGVAVTLNNIALLEWGEGNLERASAALTEALKYRRQMGDSHGTAIAQNNLGLIAIELQNYDGALVLLEEACEAFTACGDRAAHAQALIALGDAHYYQGGLDAARRLYNRARSHFISLDDHWGIAAALLSVADVDLREERHFAAATFYAKALDLSVAVPDHIAHSTLGFSGLAQLIGDEDAYRQLRVAYFAARAMSERNNIRHCPVEAPEIPAHSSGHAMLTADRLSELAWRVVKTASDREIGSSHSPSSP